MSREAMQMALEALESDPMSHAGLVSRKQAITILRQALETEQEPVLWLKTWPDGSVTVLKTKSHAFADHELEPLYAAVEGWVKIDEVREHFDAVGCGTIYKSAGEGRSPLYTAPPNKQWVGLTLNEAEEFYDKYTDRAELINAIDSFLEEKNA